MLAGRYHALAGNAVRFLLVALIIIVFALPVLQYLAD
jgi:hypothetical protein